MFCIIYKFIIFLQLTTTVVVLNSLYDGWMDKWNKMQTLVIFGLDMPTKCADEVKKNNPNKRPKD